LYNIGEKDSTAVSCAHAGLLSGYSVPTTSRSWWRWDTSHHQRSRSTDVHRASSSQDKGARCVTFRRYGFPDARGTPVDQGRRHACEEFAALNNVQRLERFWGPISSSIGCDRRFVSAHCPGIAVGIFSSQT